MQFSDTQIDAMLQATGERAIFGDGSLSGLDVPCNFKSSRQEVNEHTMTIEASDPSVRVRRSDVEGFLDRNDRVYVNGTDYRVREFDHKHSGFTIVYLVESS